MAWDLVEAIENVALLAVGVAAPFAWAWWQNRKNPPQPERIKPFLDSIHHLTEGLTEAKKYFKVIADPAAEHDSPKVAKTIATKALRVIEEHAQKAKAAGERM